MGRIQSVLNIMAGTESLGVQACVNIIAESSGLTLQAAVAILTGNTYPGKSVQNMLNEFLGKDPLELSEQACWDLMEIPYFHLADQKLLGYPVPASGLIPGSPGSLPAQLVEQPAGISAGAGTLTFSEDIDSVVSFGNAVAGTATINGGDAKQLDLSADTFWDINLIVNGKAIRIPDPFTGYDINNNYHGTVANITAGTQDESAVIQSIGFNKYFKCLTNGTIRIYLQGAYTYRYYNLSTTTWSDESGTVTAGNYFVLAIEAGDLAGQIKIDGNYPSEDVADWNIVSGTFENHLVPADLSNPTYDVLGNPLHYLPKGILPLGAIEFKPTDGSNLVTNGTFDTDSDWAKGTGWTIAGGKGVATNVTVGTAILSQQILLENHTYQITFTVSDLTGGNLSGRIGSDWYKFRTITSDGTYTVEATNTSSNVTFGFQARNSALTCKIDNVVVTDITETKLEVYNRNNIIGQPSEYWKEEIQLLESFNPTYPWRHDLDELTNGDYIRVFGTQLLIQRLFLKAFKTDDDWTAISNILNYSEVLDATERQKVFNYLKDPSKENQEAWEVYQGSTVVAAYRFDQPLSLFNEDGELCKLGWEGEDLFDGWDFTSGWIAGSGATIDNATTFTGGASNNWIYKNIPLVSGQKYSMHIVGSHTGSSFYVLGSDFAYSYCGDLITPIDSTFSFIASNATLMLRCVSGTVIITTLEVRAVGDTVAKVLDVGSGGVDGLTYYNLTQSDLSKQPKRVAGGIYISKDILDFTEISLNDFEIEFVNLKRISFQTIHLLSKDSTERVYVDGTTLTLRINNIGYEFTGLTQNQLYESVIIKRVGEVASFIINGGTPETVACATTAFSLSAIGCKWDAVATRTFQVESIVIK